jgi:hypothetical protein
MFWAAGFGSFGFFGYFQCFLHRGQLAVQLAGWLAASLAGWLASCHARASTK